MLQEFLATIPPEQIVIAIGAVGVIVSAIIGFIGKRIIAAIEKNTSVKFSESAVKQVDVVAAWSAGYVTQKFKTMLLPAEVSNEEVNKEKMDLAIKTARSKLPEDVSQKFSDDDLRVVIESKVALSKAPPPLMPTTTVSIPPTTYVEVPTSKYPANK